MELTQHQADAFARMPLTYLRQEYPNHIMHLLNDDGDVLPPRELHPIFYGCFDWHSAVHGYWLLLRCVRLYPELPCRDEIVALFDEHLTEEKVAQELAYFNAPFRASFERPYGYGWLLALAQELKQSALPEAAGWYQTLQPLTQDIRGRLMDYLSKLTYPMDPAEVSDRTDPKIAHLDGLNLSRAWCMKHIAKALPAQHAGQQALSEAVERHLAASVEHVVGSHYSGGHWLASFALLALE